jgi:hypothetical protein
MGLQILPKYFSHDEPLLPPDVEICQAVFDEISHLQGIDRGPASRD